MSGFRASPDQSLGSWCTKRTLNTRQSPSQRLSGSRATLYLRPSLRSPGKTCPSTARSPEGCPGRSQPPAASLTPPFWAPLLLTPSQTSQGFILLREKCRAGIFWHLLYFSGPRGISKPRKEPGPGCRPLWTQRLRSLYRDLTLSSALPGCLSYGRASAHTGCSRWGGEQPLSRLQGMKDHAHDLSRQWDRRGRRLRGCRVRENFPEQNPDHTAVLACKEHDIMQEERSGSTGVWWEGDLPSDQSPSLRRAS